MTIPFYCLVALLLLVMLTKVPVAVAMARTGNKGYDNRTPRAQQAQLTGWGARALAAHQNTFESLIIFTPAVFIAHAGVGSAGASTAAILAMVHTAARYLYPAAYIADINLLRSTIWGVGYGSAIWLALLPVFV